MSHLQSHIHHQSRQTAQFLRRAWLGDAGYSAAADFDDDGDIDLQDFRILAGELGFRGCG
jgi:hypothetical protein